MSHLPHWIAAAAFALLLSALWDQPTEIEATEAVAAEVAALTTPPTTKDLK